MVVGNAATGRVSKNRTRACTHGYASWVGQAARQCREESLRAFLAGTAL